MPRRVVSIRLEDACDEYLRDQEALRLAPKTLEAIRSTLNAFKAIVGPSKVVRNIDKADITDYFTARSSQRTAGYDVLRQSTLNLHVVRLNAFFRWCEEEGYIEATVRPMRGRKAVKFVERERSRITMEQFGAFLDSGNTDPRKRMLLAMGLYTMLRSSEIATITVADLSLPDETVQVVRWKTRVRDTLPVTAELREELQAYLPWYSRTMGQQLQPDWLLIPGNKPGAYGYLRQLDPVTRRFTPVPVTDKWINPTRPFRSPQRVVQAGLKAIGWDVEPYEGMHTLRRSAARELFESLREEGFDSALLTVMSWLGHSQPETTMIYLGLDRENDRRNRKYKGKIMFPRARQQQVDQVADNVVILPARARGE